MHPTAAEVSESVRNSMHNVLSEAETLIDTLRKEGGEQYGAAIDRLQSRVQETRDQLGDYRRSLVRSTRRAARIVDDAAHEHPWTAAATAMTVGALVGAIVAVVVTRR